MRDLSGGSSLETIRKAQTGDARAWEKLVQQYAGPVFSLCYRFAGTPDKAEDLSQEAFIKLFQILNRFDPDQGSFSTWMLSVVRNLLIDEYRKDKAQEWMISMDEPAQGTELQETIASSAPTPQRVFEARERMKLLREALTYLPLELREAVVLRDLEELSYQEIARVLNLPEGTVKSRINRGRIELAKVLRHFDFFTAP
ncbi:MAG: RNA polymerase sigma factor [Acidobacteriota bacterium]